MARLSLPLIPLLLVPILLIGRSCLQKNETFQAAHYSPEVLHVRILANTEPGHYQAEVLRTLKGDVSPRGVLVLFLCCDLDPSAGQEYVIMVDASHPQLWICGKEGGWPAFRRCEEGSVVWDDWGSPRVPLWLWRLFLPRTTRPWPVIQGG